MQRRLLMLLAGLVAALLAGPALALSVGGPGLDAGFGCPSGSGTCAASQTFSLDAIAAATGSIDFDGSTLDISLTVAQSDFSGSGGAVTFTNTTYVATGVTGMVGGNTVTLVPFTGSVDVDGTLDGVGFNDLAPITTGACTLVGGELSTCGITFGQTGFTLTADGAPTDFVHTFNLTLPEPGTAMLMALAVVGLGRRFRR